LPCQVTAFIAKPFDRSAQADWSAGHCRTSI